MLHFDRSTVKHALQNIQYDCHQWLSHSFRVHQIHFRPGLCPRPRWGAYSAHLDPLAGLRGPYFYEEGERGEKRMREGRGREGKGVYGRGGEEPGGERR